MIACGKIGVRDVWKIEKIIVAPTADAKSVTFRQKHG
jgi:hypothetical protein